MITKSMILAVAEAHTLEELTAEHNKLAREVLTSPDLITSASSGGGTSYTRQERVTISERLELLRRAIAYKAGDTRAAVSMATAAPVNINPLVS